MRQHFVSTNLEYSQSIKICDTFITCPSRQNIDSGYREYINDIAQEVHQLFKMKTTEEIKTIMKAILPMLYSSVKLKTLPGNYDITQHNPVGYFVISQTYFVMVYPWT